MSSTDVSAGSFQHYETLEACPVCGSAGFARAFEPNVAQCSQCGVYFRNPRPTQPEIQRSYDFGSNYEDWQKAGDTRRPMWQRRLDLIRPFQKTGKLLDVGAGDGYFLDVAKEAGFETVGTEFSNTGAAYAEKRKHKLLLGQVDEIDFKGETFDVVTLWHVLEHLPNPGKALDIIHVLLRPGGILALAVPDEENHLFRHRIGLRRNGPNPLGDHTWAKEIHLTHFQPATLRRALRSHGYEVLRFGVDDIYPDRTAKNLAKLTMQKTLSALLQWHFSMAMYCIARKV